MGKCRSYRPRKRKFQGNQNKRASTASSNEIMTASSLKLQQCNEVSNECNHHKGSSSSMEPVGAYRIFERSEDHRMLRFTDYYGDGDSKAFDAVKDIYGKRFCYEARMYRAYSKRVGTRLRKLKSRNKGLGGKNQMLVVLRQRNHKTPCRPSTMLQMALKGVHGQVRQQTVCCDTIPYVVKQFLTDMMNLTSGAKGLI
ncbi:uncharacterized protein TNCV_2003041 [Trichonephila clavipes]|nr:uncharacterized protein TNCV_2003041 [Trichonephila clavipes]